MLGICGGFQMLGRDIRDSSGIEGTAGACVSGLGLPDVRTEFAFLSAALGRAPSEVSFAAARERRVDLLGDLVEEHLDVDVLLALARSGAPSGLPFLPPGPLPRSAGGDS